MSILERDESADADHARLDRNVALHDDRGMTVSLTPLRNGRVSLEFERTDATLVATVIQDSYGKPEQRSSGSVLIYTFGGCSFVYQTEWDDPCFISTCEAGNEILWNVAVRCRKRLADRGRPGSSV